MADFTETVRNIVNSRLSTVYTALPAVVESFKNGKATVKPAVSIAGSDKLPVLGDVPVMFPSSKTAGIVFEVSKGDPVLLVFATSSLDEWLQSNGTDTDTDDPRRFDLTDAIAIPGLFPFGNAPELSATDGCVMNYEDTTITIKKSGDIVLGGKSAKALVTDTFVDLFNTHTHPTTSPGSPTSAPAVPIQKPLVTTSVVTAE